MLNVCRMDSEETKREKSRKNALGNKRKCLLAKFLLCNVALVQISLEKSNVCFFGQATILGVFFSAYLVSCYEEHVKQ